MLFHDSNMELIEFLIGLVEHDLPNLNGHSVHVHRLSMLTYDQLQWPLIATVNKRELELASILFNIGKLDILKKVSTKDGRFSEDDRKMMMDYPSFGAYLVSLIPRNDNVAKIIRWHHAHSGDTGYEGEQIPFASRIIAVCDVYSALVMNRSYRPTRSYEEAVMELELASGTQLDREAVEAFRRIPMSLVKKCDDEVRHYLSNYEFDREMVRERGWL